MDPREHITLTRIERRDGVIELDILKDRCRMGLTGSGSFRIHQPALHINRPHRLMGPRPSHIHLQASVLPRRSSKTTLASVRPHRQGNCANVWRIEGWRNTRSYYAFIQDLAAAWNRKPVRSFDLAHQHDRPRLLKLSHEDSGAIYIALSANMKTYDKICQLLYVTLKSNAGLFYISFRLFHPNSKVRASTVDLLERTMGHDAGTYFWAQLLFTNSSSPACTILLPEAVAYLDHTPKESLVSDLN